jgi:hypothetical protein
MIVSRNGQNAVDTVPPALTWTLSRAGTDAQTMISRDDIENRYFMASSREKNDIGKKWKWQNTISC